MRWRRTRAWRAALGVDPARVNAATFTAGAALTGLAGALLAPMTGVVPTIGVAYVAKAFVTVIAGGASAVAGLLSSSALLGGVATAVGYVATPILGEVALLAARAGRGSPVAARYRRPILRRALMTLRP